MSFMVTLVNTLNGGGIKECIMNKAIEKFNNELWLKELKEQYNKCSELFDVAWEINRIEDTRTEFSRMVVSYVPDVMRTLGSCIHELEYRLKDI